MLYVLFAKMKYVYIGKDNCIRFLIAVFVNHSNNVKYQTVYLVKYLKIWWSQNESNFYLFFMHEFSSRSDQIDIVFKF